MNVRRIRASESAELRRVRLAMLQDAPEAFHARHEEEAAKPPSFWEQRARGASVGDRVATFVAADGDRHLGTATVLRFGGAEPALLVAMWVDPAARRAGIGIRLIEAACRWARRRGSRCIELQVREQNAGAIELYRRAGFEVAGEPAPAPGDPTLTELTMRRRLDMAPEGPVVARLRRTEGDLVDRLAALPGSDLRSLLLHETRRRAAAATPADVLRARTADPLVTPVPRDAVALRRAGLLALEAAAGFEPVALSPVSPAGINTALGGLDQNLSLATVRGTEVLADPTAALALEAALRRRAGEREVALCWAGRVLRTRPTEPGWYQHFELFAMVSAGLREPEHGFGLRAVEAHLRTYLTLIDRLDAGDAIVEVSDPALLRALCAEAGVDIADLADEARESDEEPEHLLAAAGVQVPRFTTEAPEASAVLGLVAGDVYARLAPDFPRARFGFRPARLAGVGYYSGLLVNIDLDRAGQRLSVADGGTTHWTQRLLSNRRERLFTSGIGLERLTLSGPLP